MLPTRTALLLALTLASGCLDTSNERIVVQRDFETLEKKRRTARLSYDEFLEQRVNEKQAQEWDLGFTRRDGQRADAGLWSAVPQYAIRESIDHDRATREQVRALVDGIGEDPFRGFEQHRRDVLWKNWADRQADQPAQLEPDTDGPPGWLGPKAAPALPGPITPPEDGEDESEE